MPAKPTVRNRFGRKNKPVKWHDFHHPRRGLFSNREFSKQGFEVACFGRVVVIGQRGKQLAFAEPAGTDERMVRPLFETWNQMRPVAIEITAFDDFLNQPVALGTAGNSPAIHCRGGLAGAPPSPVRTDRIK